MNNLKQKIMIVVAIIGALLVLIFSRGIYGKTGESSINEVKSTQNAEPQVVSTIPQTLNEAVILPTQVVEITFNMPLENVGEFKYKLEPKIDHQIKLSDDRQTARIISVKPLPLGTTFTLFILPDTKFDGKKTLSKDLIYHFKTLEYKGV